MRDRDRRGAADDRAAAADPSFNVRTGGDEAAAAQFFDQIKMFALNGQSTTAGLPAPPCDLQEPYDSIGVDPERTQYLHVKRFP